MKFDISFSDQLEYFQTFWIFKSSTACSKKQKAPQGTFFLLPFGSLDAIMPIIVKGDLIVPLSVPFLFIIEIFLDLLRSEEVPDRLDL